MYTYYLIAVFTVVGYNKPVFVEDLTFIKHKTRESCVEQAEQDIPKQIIAANNMVMATATYYCIPVRRLTHKWIQEMPQRECDEVNQVNCLRGI